MATTIPKQAKRFTQLQLISTDSLNSGGETANIDGLVGPTVTYEAFYNEIPGNFVNYWNVYLEIPLRNDKFYAIFVEGNLHLQGESNARSRQFYHRAIFSGDGTQDVEWSLEYFDYISDWFWGLNDGIVSSIHDGDVMTARFSLPVAIFVSKDFTVQGIVKIFSS